MISKQMKCINNKNKHNITVGKYYEIHGECTGDLCRYLLIVDDSGNSKWVGEDMFEEDVLKETNKPTTYLTEDEYNQHPSNLTAEEIKEAISRCKEYKKQPRIIDLILDNEDENRNISIDLQRVQAVDEVKDNGFYEVLMVSGVKYKLPNSTQQGVAYSRKDVVKAWKTFHNS